MKLGYLFPFGMMALLCSAAFSAHHAFQRKPLVDTSLIDQWMESPATAPKSVEEFLGKLPLIYRSHFVLMYESRSMHRATPDNPRIIFFGPDARLLTAVSTDPSDPRRNIVELIEFEPNQSKFGFHEISFGGGALQVNHSPQKCQNCHGTDLRPNWEPYDAWPGSYGSVHDKMEYLTHENSLFSKFLANYKREPRFLSLPDQFVMRQETFHGGPTYYTASRGVGLNSTFSLLVSFANRERITRIITQSSNHSAYRNAITAALLGCFNDPETSLPKNLRKNHPRSYSTLLAETRNYITNDHNRRVKKTAELQRMTDLEEFGNNVDLYGLREREIVRTAKLRYLLENRSIGSVRMNDWALGLYRDSYNFNDGTSGLENLIGHYVPVAFSDKEPLKAKIQYKMIPFHATSYSDSEHPGYSREPEAFKLELFEALEPSSDLCAELSDTITPSLKISPQISR